MTDGSPGPPRKRPTGLRASPGAGETGSGKTGPGPKRLGVLGTLVWDTIRHPGASGPVEAWGGIAYALTAFDEVLAPDWTVVPVLKIGSDLAAEATAYLHSFACIGDMDFVHSVAEPNNRVELVYSTPSDRVEILRGGVPGWSADEIGTILPGLDALYANFISGRELDLAGARRIRDGLSGPSYADLHSLFLGIESDGRRNPRYLPSCEEWAGCFDTVQMNQDEFALFAGGAGDPWSAAQRALAGRVGTVVVTRGAEGVEFMTTGERHGSVNRERVPVEPGPAPSDPAPGDPTGCGDVWGATFFSGVLAGSDPGVAIDRAQAMARGKLECSGAEEFRRALARAPRRRWSSA